MKLSMPEILADSNFMQEIKVKVHYTPAYMHHVSEKGQVIRSSVTAL